MPGIDFSNWPTWALLILMIVVNFKDQLGSLIPSSVLELFRFKADEQDHSQEIEKALVDSKLQTNAAEQLRDSWREEQLFEMIFGKDAYLYEFMGKEVQGVKQGLDHVKDEVAGLRQDVREMANNQIASGKRTNDLLTLINVNLSEIAKRRAP